MTAAPKLPRSFNGETGELVDADGNARILSDAEMARYWETEAIAAHREGAAEAADRAQGKAMFYRKRARSAAQRKAAEKNPKT